MDELRQFKAIDNDLVDLIDHAEALNENGKPTRSRELSLAITKLEEARHWLADATLALPRTTHPVNAPTEVEREAGVLR